MVRQRDLAPETLAEAVRAADAFRDCATERGFSMALSRLGDLRDGDCLLVLCRDTEFRIRGVLQFVPWGPHGLSLDVMRGDGTAVNGLMELMVVSAVEAAPDLGVERVSLNFAVLRSVFARAKGLAAEAFLRRGRVGHGAAAPSRGVDRGRPDASAAPVPALSRGG